MAGRPDGRALATATLRLLRPGPSTTPIRFRDIYKKIKSTQVVSTLPSGATTFSPLPGLISAKLTDHHVLLTTQNWPAHLFPPIRDIFPSTESDGRGSQSGRAVLSLSSPASHLFTFVCNIPTRSQRDNEMCEIRAVSTFVSGKPPISCLRRVNNVFVQKFPTFHFLIRRSRKLSTTNGHLLFVTDRCSTVHPQNWCDWPPNTTDNQIDGHPHSGSSGWPRSGCRSISPLHQITTKHFGGK